MTALLMLGQPKIQITFLTNGQYSSLVAGLLSREERNQSGFYMVEEDNGTFVACDYSCQEQWLLRNGAPDNPSKMPEGWVEEFDNLLDAINWLLGEAYEVLQENTLYRIYRRWQLKRKFRQVIDLDYGDRKAPIQRNIPLRIFNTKRVKSSWKR